MLSKELLVFPTNRSIREYISKSKTTNQLLPKLITIGELLNRVVLPAPNKKHIDKDLRIIYLQLAIEQIDIKKLGLSNQFEKLYLQSDYVFKFFNELNSEFKTIDDLTRNDTYGFYAEHLDLLNQIYKKYIDVLAQNNLCDNITLPLDYQINSMFLDEFSKITIFYEGFFSSFEFFTIKEMAQITNIKIIVEINRFNYKNIELFETLGLSLKSGNLYTIDISNNSIIKQEASQKAEQIIEIYEIPTRLTQIGMVKNSINKMVNNGIEASKIVLILPDEKFSKYVKFFDDDGYFNFAMGSDIKNSQTYTVSSAINNYLNIDEPKHQKRVEYLNLDKSYIDEKIRNIWNKPIEKSSFFEIFKFISKDEKNTDILKHLEELKFFIENLFFNNLLLNELSLKDGFKIFMTKLAQLTIDDVKAGKVTVMGILETRHTKFDGVIVIDFNDNVVPKRSTKDKFISTNVKKFSNLPTPQDRENLQKYYYQKLFNNGKYVDIAYVSNRENTMSRFINELFEAPKIQKVDFSNIIYKNIKKEISPKEITKKIDLSKLEWSATSLKVFLECKRKYYFGYILKLNEHDITLKPKNFELGNIIHNILEQNYKSKKYTLDEFINQISTYQNINPYLTLELELWKKRIKKFFHNEMLRIESGVEIFELERNFRIVQNGVVLKGKIDRIDRLKDGTFAILDYKTGSNLKIDTDKTIEKSVDFQLEFYYLASKNLGVSVVGYYDLNSGTIKDEIVLEGKLKRLDEILISLKTTNVDFVMCDDKKVCEFCPYTILCDKD